MRPDPTLTIYISCPVCGDHRVEVSLNENSVVETCACPRCGFYPMDGEFDFWDDYVMEQFEKNQYLAKDVMKYIVKCPTCLNNSATVETYSPFGQGERVFRVYKCALCGEQMGTDVALALVIEQKAQLAATLNKRTISERTSPEDIR